jgi:hypothetical protein
MLRGAIIAPGGAPCLLPLTERRMGPGPGALAETGLWMVALGALLGPGLADPGAAAAPRLGGDRPRCLAGGRLRRWPRLAPWPVGVLLFAGGVYAPSTYLAWTTPSAPERHPAAAAPPGAPDVVLVVLDTVRAKNVSSYGHRA